MGQPGFFDLGERYRGLDAKKDPLVVLNAVVPWEDFRAQLSAVWRKPGEERKTAAGLKPWDEIVIFKTLVLQALYTRIPQMDQLPGDLLALFIEEVQRLAQGEVGSFCFHPLHPPRLGFACQRKLLIQLRNLACRAECASIHLGNPGLEQATRTYAKRTS